MTYLKVYDQVSNIERTVTQKAYDIINKRKQRYKFIEYVDENGNPIQQTADAPQEVIQKKTEVKNQDAEPVAAEVPEAITETSEPEEGVKVIRRKPGPKPKQHAKE